MSHSKLSPEALAFFKDLCEEAGNWSGSPLVDLTSNQEKGYLTACKKAGLLSTEESDGCEFVNFKPAGVALAASLGMEI